MKFLKFSLLTTALGFGLLAVTNAHADTMFTNQAAYNAATTGNTTVGFNGIVANGTSTGPITPRTVSVGGVGFSTTDNGPMFEIGANFGSGHYGTDATLSSQNSTSGSNNIVITLPTGSDAVSLLVNSFIDTANVFTADNPIMVALSDGATFSVTDPVADGSYLFLGFTSTTPITSITISDPGVAGSTLNLAQVQYGSLAPTPEPSTISLLALGMCGLLFAGVVNRKKLATGTLVAR